MKRKSTPKPDTRSEFTRWVDAENAGASRETLCAMARAMVDPEFRRRAMRSLGIETPAQKRETAERVREIRAWYGSVTQAEINRHCQFPAAPAKAR